MTEDESLYKLPNVQFWKIKFICANKKAHHWHAVVYRDFNLISEASLYHLQGHPYEESPAIPKTLISWLIIDNWSILAKDSYQPSSSCQADHVDFRFYHVKKEFSSFASFSYLVQIQLFSLFRQNFLFDYQKLYFSEIILVKKIISRLNSLGVVMEEMFADLTPQSQSCECNLPVPNVPWGDVFDKW